MTEQEERDGHLRLVWNTLMFFASESSYTTGERIGGVLQGCPRKPPPTEYEMAGYARRALESVRRYLGQEPEDWLLNGDSVPEPTPLGAFSKRPGAYSIQHHPSSWMVPEGEYQLYAMPAVALPRWGQE